MSDAGPFQVSRSPSSRGTGLSAQFEIVRTLGQGSFGTVKLARNVATSDHVAVKVIDKRLLTDELAEVRTRREIATLQSMKHANIISFRGVEETGTHIYVLMEYASRGEIFDFVVGRGRLHEDMAAAVFKQLVDAVWHVRKHNVVHRDLKPENFLLDADWNVKLSDFGFCNFFIDPVSGQRRRCQTPCGSPTYAAPEIFRGEPYTEMVDTWSLGVNLYVFVTGQSPWGDDNTSYRRRKKRIQRADYQPPSYLSAECKHLISIMLKANAADRASLKQVSEHRWLKRATRPLAELLAEEEREKDSARATPQSRGRTASSAGNHDTSPAVPVQNSSTPKKSSPSVATPSAVRTPPQQRKQQQQQQPTAAVAGQKASSPIPFRSPAASSAVDSLGSPPPLAVGSPRPGSLLAAAEHSRSTNAMTVGNSAPSTGRSSPLATATSEGSSRAPSPQLASSPIRRPLPTTPTTLPPQLGSRPSSRTSMTSSPPMRSPMRPDARRASFTPPRADSGAVSDGQVMSRRYSQADAGGSSANESRRRKFAERLVAQNGSLQFSGAATDTIPRSPLSPNGTAMARSGSRASRLVVLPQQAGTSDSGLAPAPPRKPRTAFGEAARGEDANDDDDGSIGSGPTSDRASVRSDGGGSPNPFSSGRGVPPTLRRLSRNHPHSRSLDAKSMAKTRAEADAQTRRAELQQRLERLAEERGQADDAFEGRARASTMIDGRMGGSAAASNGASPLLHSAMSMSASNSRRQSVLSSGDDELPEIRAPPLRGRSETDGVVISRLALRLATDVGAGRQLENWTDSEGGDA